MSKKPIIIFLIIAIIAILGWIFLFPAREKSITVQTAKEFPAKQSQNITRKEKEIKNQPQSISGILSYSEQTDEPEIFKKSDPLLEDIGNIASTFTNSFAPQASETNQVSQSSNDVDPAAIERQIFETLFPDYIIEAYADTQESYIKLGYLDENYEKIENFDTEEKIFAFVNTNINVFEEIGLITKSEAVKFRIGANQIWRDILEKEKLELKKQLIGSEIGSEFYKRILTNRIYYISRSISKKIAKILKELKDKTIIRTYAADCYRGGDPAPGGSNNANVPCCNCGLNCNKHGCYPVPDCGSGCDIDLGCLNKYAGGNKPAIWDPATGICGVG